MQTGEAPLEPLEVQVVTEDCDSLGVEGDHPLRPA